MEGSIMKKKVTLIISMVTSVLLMMLFGAQVSAKSNYNLKAAEKTANSVTITWSAQKGADVYRVYLYNGKKGKFVEYKVVSDTKCRITDLSPSKSYKVKVRSLEKDGGRYTKISESGVVTIKTASKNQVSNKPSGVTADISKLITWDFTWEGYANEDIANSEIKKYLDRFTNAGYTVDDYNYGTRNYHLYNISLNGAKVGVAHAEKTEYYDSALRANKWRLHVYFRRGSGEAVVPEHKSEPSTPVSKLLTWDYTWAEYGSEDMCDSGIKTYLDKFRNAGYTVDDYNQGTRYYQHYTISYDGRVVGTVYADKSEYYNINVDAYNWKVHLYFKKSVL